MSKPTDEEIILVLTKHGRCMTYVVTNWLRDKYWSLDTAYVLRRLKKLESAGKVQRVKSVYKTQICWEVSQ
ncbi:hypothetical protein [Citrobacter freundii]|uniref:hypothetical protein n=1 Tax=Citrobacter freundii TaxID=546 RepID=UPI001C7DBCF9|nr:hypothetical protein [Citrobacter freundii]